MRLIRAEHLGMCFGVRDAIALATDQAKTKPLTILGQLVHNPTVLAQLDAAGVRTAKQLSEVETREVLISAHGASDRTIEAVRRKGHTVIEATCPLVHHAHKSLRKLVQDGFHPVVIGLRDHVEVRGLTEDWPTCDIVLTPEEIAQIKPRPRFGVVAQTTQPIEKVRHLVGLMRQRFPDSEIRFIDTVCQPTKQRQSAAADLARRCDVVIVIGGANSNNTRELVATCQQFCDRVHHVQTPANLKTDWFLNARTVGLTAGTSTPDETIQLVEQAILQIDQHINRPRAVAPSSLNATGQPAEDVCI